MSKVPERAIRCRSGQGMHWIRDARRLAIYLRDGLACVYCGASVETGVTMTLDHLMPYKKGGDHHETNLVTACLVCNSSRGTRPVAEFVNATAEYLRLDPERILQHIKNTRRRKLDLKSAKEMIARRGTAAQVLAHRMFDAQMEEQA